LKPTASTSSAPLIIRCSNQFTFFNPNGQRLELAANTGNWKKAADAAPAMLDAWNTNGSAGDLGSWFHAKELGKD
jgi:hypothetical protein